MTFPQIDPILFSLGPFHVRWYGLMYVLGFIACSTLVRKQIKTFGYSPLEPHFENLNLVLILCVILGGRLGYVFFYNFSYFMDHPLEIAATWNGGMSFHGATIACIVGGFVFTKRKQLDFWTCADFYVVTIPIGLGLGRIGNFINGELFGRVSTVPWAMVFPNGGPSPRHPSQLYEALLEGILLFTFLYIAKKKPWEKDASWPHGSLLCLFLICYGSIRIFVELFREPDQQLGFFFQYLTMGQLLSSLMIGSGAALWWWLRRKAKN